MTRPSAAKRLGFVPRWLAVIVGVAGCVYYPTIDDVGGPRLTPERGRIVRQASGAAVYFDLNSTGKFGDVLTGVTAPVAGRAEVVSPSGTPVERLAVPGVAVMSFRPGDHHIRLDELTRPLVVGETVIVTLRFEKSGGIGLITVVE